MLRRKAFFLDLPLPFGGDTFNPGHFVSPFL
jgi:hypothetical protein